MTSTHLFLLNWKRKGAILLSSPHGNGKEQITLINNFPEIKTISEIEGEWEVSFDPKWGGPEKIIFDKLEDWSERQEEGIKYYSGLATYYKQFDFPELNRIDKNSDIYLDLGQVNNLARIRLNGKDLGIIWTSPWRVSVTDEVKESGNRLEIDIVNLWANRLIGDENKPDDGVKDGQWPEWLLEGSPRTSGRYTFTTHRYYKKDMKLEVSGLLGPVLLQVEK